jgi:hypothetical protein
MEYMKHLVWIATASLAAGCTPSVATFSAPTTNAETLATLTAPAQAANLLQGFEAYDASGNVLTGTMKDIPALNLAEAFAGPAYVESITGLAASQVCTSAIFLGTTGTAVCLSGNLSTPAVAGQVVAGMQFFDNSGTVKTGTMVSQGAFDASASFPGAGYYNGTVTNLPTASQIQSGVGVTRSHGYRSARRDEWGDQRDGRECLDRDVLLELKRRQHRRHDGEPGGP